jgi:hypothetical protein
MNSNIRIKILIILLAVFVFSAVGVQAVLKADFPKNPRVGPPPAGIRANTSGVAGPAPTSQSLENNDISLKNSSESSSELRANKDNIQNSLWYEAVWLVIIIVFFIALFVFVRHKFKKR